MSTHPVSHAVISAAILLGSIGHPLICYAALPDQDTYNLVKNRYSLELEGTRSGCTYYANPRTLEVQDNMRSISVLMTRGDRGGTMCNGEFQFQYLRVRCQTGESIYSDQMQNEWQRDEALAQKVPSVTI